MDGDSLYGLPPLAKIIKKKTVPKKIKRLFCGRDMALYAHGTRPPLPLSPTTSRVIKPIIPRFNYDSLTSSSPMFKKYEEIAMVHQPNSPSTSSSASKSTEIAMVHQPNAPSTSSSASNSTEIAMVHQSNVQTTSSSFYREFALQLEDSEEEINSLVVYEPEFNTIDQMDEKFQEIQERREEFIEPIQPILNVLEQSPIEERPSFFQSISQTMGCAKPKKIKKGARLSLADFQMLTIDEKLDKIYEERSKELKEIGKINVETLVEVKELRQGLKSIKKELAIFCDANVEVELPFKTVDQLVDFNERCKEEDFGRKVVSFQYIIIDIYINVIVFFLVKLLQKIQIKNNTIKTAGD